VAQNSTKTVTYADAGVDIDRATAPRSASSTWPIRLSTKGRTERIVASAAYSPLIKRSFLDPVLVSSVDGGVLGTKLKVAFDMRPSLNCRRRPWSTTAVNDIAVQGATPMFSWTTWPPASWNRKIAEKVVEGLSTACKHNGCALIGGETAEMPGFYLKANTTWLASS